MELASPSPDALEPSPAAPQPAPVAPQPAPVAPQPAPASAKVARTPALIVLLIVGTIFGLTLWDLTRPQPLVIQGEADATRIDIAARVDGKVLARPVERGDTIAAGQLLYEIDNPELATQLREAQAALGVASAQWAHIQAGTRAEEIAQKKAALDSAQASLTLAQQTYDRIKDLVASGFEPLQHLDEATASLQVARRGADQAKLGFEEAQAGYTAEERAIARAGVAKAEASIATIKAEVDELSVKAPIAGQVYQIGAERGEYVSPGVPLLSLVDLGDLWLRFDFREDLVRGLKVGDPIQLHVPALGDRVITANVKVIAAKGEYAGWRATRATGDFDLRTFEVRAYPAEPVPGLRPGMSVYAELPAKRP